MNKAFTAAKPQIKSYDPIWEQVRREAEETSADEPVLASLIYATILSEPTLEDAVCHTVAHRLQPSVDTGLLHKTFRQVLTEDPGLGDNCSMLHGVTLGGTGNERDDRHPKIGCGVMMGSGAKILGNIHIGDCVRVAAGSVVVQDVPPRRTVAGVPARDIGPAGCEEPALSMDQLVRDGTDGSASPCG